MISHNPIFFVYIIIFVKYFVDRILLFDIIKNRELSLSFTRIEKTIVWVGKKTDKNNTSLITKN